MELSEAKEDMKRLTATVIDTSSAVGKILETQEMIQQSISAIWTHLGMLSHSPVQLLYQGPLLPAPGPSTCMSTPVRNAVPQTNSS